MGLTRRDAVRISGSALVGMSMGGLTAEKLRALPHRRQDWPDGLVEMPLRDRVPLPLNPDGSAPEHPESEAGPIEGVIWRYTEGQPPEIDFDYRTLRVRVDPRGMARLGGTLKFPDLEALPRVSHVFLLQCGVPTPTGIVKWTGVRFRDFAEMLGVQDQTIRKGYCRVVGSDRHYVDEPVRTLVHPQVMLAWLMNDEPIPPTNGAPLRLVVPFRYGHQSVKAVTEIHFGTPGLPQEPLPV
jgi:DMSO/TMAO reductase YedYZ molybdopterin-dependent catalytic subunit